MLRRTAALTLPTLLRPSRRRVCIHAEQVAVTVIAAVYVDRDFTITSSRCALAVIAMSGKLDTLPFEEAIWEFSAFYFAAQKQQMTNCNFAIRFEPTRSQSNKS